MVSSKYDYILDQTESITESSWQWEISDGFLLLLFYYFFFVLHSSPSTRKWKGSSHAFHNNIRPRKNGMGQCWKEVASKTARATFDGLRFLWPTCSEFDRANSTERSLVYRKSNHPWKTSSQFLVADMAAAVHVHPSPIPPLEPVYFTLKFLFFSFFFLHPIFFDFMLWGFMLPYRRASWC